MSEYAVSDETQARINDVLLDAYNRGRAAFAADLAEQGKVVVDRPLLERLGKAYEMQDDIYCNAIFEAVHDLLVATMKPSHV